MLTVAGIPSSFPEVAVDDDDDDAPAAAAIVVHKAKTCFLTTFSYSRLGRRVKEDGNMLQHLIVNSISTQETKTSLDEDDF